MSTAKQPLQRSIQDVLAHVTKRASAYNEKGSQGGETSHPVKDVDDGCRKATEGFRSEENTAAVKEDIGEPSVDSTSPGTPGGQQSVQSDVGVTSKLTGTDPTNETDKAKAGKDDPGSSHPARTDNDSLDGMKYSSLIGTHQHLSKTAAMLGDELLAELAAEGHEQSKSARSTTSKPGAPAVAAPVAKTAADAAEALADSTSPMFDKQALDAVLVDAVADTILDAEDMATKVAQYIHGVNVKRAEDESSEPAGEDDGSGGPPANPSDSGAEPGGSGHAAPPSPAAAPGGAGGGGGNEAMLMQLIQLLLGGQQMGGQDAAAGMMGDGAGGAPMGGGAPGADPMAAAGGAPGADPMAAAGGAPGGGGGGDDMAMLQQALQDSGSNPAELEAGAMKAAARALTTKWAATKPGQTVWRPKTAAEKAQYDATIAYIKEVTGR